MMHALLRSPAIRAIESSALAAGAPLMARAGLAAAKVARAMLLAARYPARVLGLAGPGNTGGDGVEAATHLRTWGIDVVVVFAATAEHLPADAATAYRKWRLPGGSTVDRLPPLAGFDLVVDAMFGIGLARPITAPYAEWIAALNGSGMPVLALDVPSGLDADTGYEHGLAVRASHTLTFIGDKPGLYTGSGPDCAGTIEVAALQLRPALIPGPDCGALTGPEDFSACQSPRLRNSHKGTYGTLAIIGGAPGMAGAALIAARAALKAGAGRVLVGMLDASAPAVDPACPELMLRPVDAVLEDRLDAIVVGPGLGQTGLAPALLARAATLACPLVLDADALNLIAANASLAATVSRREVPTLMTPHPLEAARLLGRTAESVQRDRIAAALAIARMYRTFVVLKGAGSVIATPAGQWWINPTGNPGMASAGMGDALAGITGAFAAQRFEAGDLLRAAVYLHGAAADALVARGIGPVGLTASEVADEARTLWNQWLHEAPTSVARPA